MPTHPFPPSGLSEVSKILILGSFPSVKSRECGFYYAHPQNRFWKVLGALFDDKSIAQNQALINNITTKAAFLQSHSLVLWDMVYSCEIKGSSDSSLKNIAFNDIFALLQSSKIQTICLNGTKATMLFKAYCKAQNVKLLQDSTQTHKCYRILTPSHSFAQIFHREISIFALPSTSPANARYSLNNLLNAWKIVLQK